MNGFGIFWESHLLDDILINVKKSNFDELFLKFVKKFKHFTLKELV
jgi:hypothetical protein